MPGHKTEHSKSNGADPAPKGKEGASPVPDSGDTGKADQKQANAHTPPDPAVLKSAFGSLDADQLAQLKKAFETGAIKAPREIFEWVKKGLDLLGGGGGGGGQPQPLPTGVQGVRDDADPPPAPPLKKGITKEDAKAILSEAERQWRLGFTHTERHKYSVGSSFNYYEPKSEKGFEWCGAFVAHCYQSAGMSHQLASQMASTSKLRDMIAYGNTFSKKHTFFDSREEIKKNPEKGIDGLKAYHEKKGQLRTGIEVLQPDQASQTKAKNIRELKVDPADPAKALQGADIQIGDIMIVGDGKAGSHITLVRDLDWASKSIGTYEGNVGTPSHEEGGSHHAMSKKSRTELNSITDAFKVQKYQVDTQYLDRQVPVLKRLLAKLELLQVAQEKGDKGWRQELDVWLNSEPGIDKRWRLLLRKKKPKQAIALIQKHYDNLSDVELHKRVEAWEKATLSSGSGEALDGRGQTRVAKVDRDIMAGEKDARRKYHNKHSVSQKRTMRFFYKLCERDLEPYYYISTEDARAAKKKS